MAATKQGYYDESDPFWQQLSAQTGQDLRDYMRGPGYAPAPQPGEPGYDEYNTPRESSPGSNEWYSPADIAGGSGPIQLTPEAVERRKSEAEAKSRQTAAIGAALIGGAALLGASGASGAAAAGSSAPAATGSGGLLGGTGAGVMAAAPATAGAAGIAAGAPIGSALMAGTGVAAAAPAGAVAAGGLLSAAKTVAPAVSKFKPVVDFLKGNKDIIGSVLEGVGNRQAAQDAYEADRDLLRERYALTAANYHGTDPAKTYRGMLPAKSAPTPQAKYDQQRELGGYEFQYDPQQGRIVRVPIQPSRDQSL